VMVLPCLLLQRWFLYGPALERWRRYVTNGRLRGCSRRGVSRRLQRRGDAASCERERTIGGTIALDLSHWALMRRAALCTYTAMTRNRRRILAFPRARRDEHLGHMARIENTTGNPWWYPGALHQRCAPVVVGKIIVEVVFCIGTESCFHARTKGGSDRIVCRLFVRVGGVSRSKATGGMHRCTASEQGETDDYNPSADSVTLALRRRPIMPICEESMVRGFHGDTPWPPGQSPH